VTQRASGGGRGTRLRYEVVESPEGEVRLHRLLAVALYGFEAVAGRQVHHANRIPWDNRPENLRLLTPSEHSRLHHTEDDLPLSVGLARLEVPLLAGVLRSAGHGEVLAPEYRAEVPVASPLALRLLDTDREAVVAALHGAGRWHLLAAEYQ